MITAETTAIMQTLLTSTSVVSGIDTADLFGRTDADLSIPLTFLEKPAAASPESHEELVQMIHTRENVPPTAADTAPLRTPRKLTRRQLKHREAMVRFRQRKKAKISVLEDEELRLQRQLDLLLRNFRKRETRRPQTANEWLGDIESRAAMRRAFVDAVHQIELALDENEALEIAIAEHEKFHVTLKRVRERTIETGMWKCI